MVEQRCTTPSGSRKSCPTASFPTPQTYSWHPSSQEKINVNLYTLEDDGFTQSAWFLTTHIILFAFFFDFHKIRIKYHLNPVQRTGTLSKEVHENPYESGTMVRILGREG
jgi:hypothetical protein